MTPDYKVKKTEYHAKTFMAIINSNNGDGKYENHKKLRTLKGLRG